MLRSIAFVLALILFSPMGGEAQAQKKLRVAYPSSADMGDIPSLLAWEQLKKQGIEVVPQFFPKTDLAVQAVLAGEADIGSAAGIAVVKAVESGMNLRVIAEQVRNEWQLVTPVSLKDPKQLDGSCARLPGTPGGALVRMARHADLSPLASVRVVVLLRCLCARCLQRRRKYRCVQQPVGVGGGHRHGPLACAPG